jgi:protein phosphatase
VTGIIEKLFGKKNKRVDEPDLTSELTKSHNHAAESTSPLVDNFHYDLPQLDVGCGHSIGRQRGHNEDAIFTLTTNIVSGMMMMPFGLYIIADGMGGHQSGEIPARYLSGRWQAMC